MKQWYLGEVCVVFNSWAEVLRVAKEARADAAAALEMEAAILAAEALARTPAALAAARLMSLAEVMGVEGWLAAWLGPLLNLDLARGAEYGSEAGGEPLVGPTAVRSNDAPVAPLLPRMGATPATSATPASTSRSSRVGEEVSSIILRGCCDCSPSRDGWRSDVRWLVSTSTFSHVATGLVLLNLLAMVMPYYGMAEDYAARLELAASAITWLFILEMGLKLCGFGCYVSVHALQLC